MSTEGTKGGSVNRPASVHEIKKLPTIRCERCLFVGPRAMIASTSESGEGGPRCRNMAACTKRLERAARRAKR